MNIGIITFHHSNNFGAVLQALSLQTILESWGHTIQILNHARDVFPLWSRWRGADGTYNQWGERLRGLLHQRPFQQEFGLFRQKHLHLSGPLLDSQSLATSARRFDALITGSDQVWHFSREPRYFLHWEPPYQGRKISYAASCGSDSQPKVNRDQIGSWLRHFDFLSVRDDFSSHLVQEISDLTPQVVADPTLLVDPLPWVKKPSFPPSEYLLLYHLGPISPEMEAQLLLLQKRHGGIPWVWINGHGDRIPHPPRCELKIWHVAPEVWLGWIQGSRLFVTDSFHAILYAIQLRKAFLVLAFDRFRSPRLWDLAKRYNLSSHMVATLETLSQTPAPQPSPDTKRAIHLHVDQSLSFLRQATANSVSSAKKTP